MTENFPVRRLAGLADPGPARLGAEGLYGHALMLGYHPIGPANAALVNHSSLGLLDRAVPGRPAPGGAASDGHGEDPRR